ncbi:hypothetical protein QBC35DRAFT_54188 [Podospora australis]|uniref:MARVEL domain-containing protein n=1 Tax=Podospora australis TaxID=1536484 RepID=A0AAN6X0R9_9PEZI|nr:hypothetical protein QBC35DRAFT_54188 [Podospora australis]
MAWQSRTITLLVLARAFQLIGALASAGLHGFVTIYIHTKQLGLTSHMIVLELLICILLVYTTLAILLQATGKRSSIKPWLVTFIVLDVLFCGMVLSIVSILARAGLPMHCAGMARSDLGIPVFGDGTLGSYGQLDKYCGLERSYYSIANALVFTYILTIVLAVIRIMEQNKPDPRFNNEDEEINLKVLSQDFEVPSPASETRPESSDRHPPPAPPSEGIITRTASLRSTFTATTTSTSSHGRSHSSVTAAPFPVNSIPRRPVGSSPAAPPLPPRVSSNAGIGFTPIPLDDDSAEAALVSDGMRHQRQQSHHHLHQVPRMPMLPEEDTDSHSPHSPHSPHHHHHHHHHHDHLGLVSDSGNDSKPRQSSEPMLLRQDQIVTSDADHALVSDGMRPSVPNLPPYEPGNQRMPGHGEGRDDLRISGYSKGER